MRGYVIGADLSAGRNDSFALTILAGVDSRTPYTALHLETDKLTWSQQEHTVLAAVARLDRTLPAGVAIGVCVDSSGVGEATAEALHVRLQRGYKDGALSRRILFRGLTVTGGMGARPKKLDGVPGGWLYTLSRQAAVTNLIADINQGVIDLRELPPAAKGILAEQMRTWKVKGDRVDHVGSDSHDDALASLMCASVGLTMLLGSVATISLPGARSLGNPTGF